MIQVYKKNELFIIENTVTDIIYPNLTREEALVLLKKFDRNEPEHRCDFAIKEDNISFEYVSLDDKDKTIADLEAKLAESEKENKDLEDDHNKLIEQYNKQYNDLCKEIKVHSDARERFVKKVEQLKQQLAEKDNTIENLRIDLKDYQDLEEKISTKYDKVVEQLAEKEKELETYKKQFNEQGGLCEEFRFQLAEKDEEIKKLQHCNDRLAQGIYHSYGEHFILKVKQDKISFAVEQLELLKEKIKNFDLPNNPKLYNNDMFCGGFDSHYIKTKEEIDNQIEELKKEMK